MKTPKKKRQIRRETTPAALLVAIQRIDSRVSADAIKVIRQVYSQRSGHFIHDAYLISEIERSLVNLAQTYVGDVARIAQRYRETCQRIGLEIPEDSDMFELIDYHVKAAAAELDPVAAMEAARNRADRCTCGEQSRSIWTPYELERMNAEM